MNVRFMPVIAWFTQPDILANDRGWERGCFSLTCISHVHV